MKSAARIAIVCALFGAAAAASVSAQESVIEILRTRGIELKSTESVAGGTRRSFAGPGGIAFAVDSNGPISVDAVGSALFLLDTLLPWKSLSPGSQNFRIEGDTAHLRLVPSRFASGAKDLRPFVPSGLSFSATGERIEYDFRVKTGSYFLRFQGRLQNESSFLSRLARAVDSPAEFARDNDPDYIVRRMAELQEEFSAVSRTREEAEARTVDLEKRLAAAEERIAALAEADRYAARGVAAVLSKGFFGAAKPVPSPVELRVVELKTATPGMAAADILKALKAEGLSANEKQVKAVLAARFGEY